MGRADEATGVSSFREALLKSEERRAAVVILVVGLIALSIVFASVTRDASGALRMVGAVAGLSLVGLELGSLAWARTARRRGTMLPRWFGPAGVTLECLVPTAVLLVHIRLGTLPAYTVLTAPPILAYGLLITITTLRLRPALCVWAGVVSAVGYVGVHLWVSQVLRSAPPMGGWPRVAYWMAPLLVLATGLASAWVAWEIRSHMEAALREASSRAKAERLEHDLSIARSIQQSLLPSSSPMVAGFEIAAWNRPADQTGGDYYDWQRLHDGRWLITLADVSGHGIGPALVTAACRAYVRATTALHSDLGALATRINQLLAEDLPEGRFVTMVGVLIDPADGRVALLSAGHGPIVLYLGASREVRDIQPHALPLAVVADERFGPAQALDLSPGDMLALVTDGFVEWSRVGKEGKREEFGMVRLRASLVRHGVCGAQELIHRVAGDLAAFAGTQPQQDDLTMVVIRRTA